MENNFIKKIINWSYLIGFFLIILQEINCFPPWFTPVDWGKALIFRTITSILLFIFTLEIIFKKRSINEIKEKIKSVSLPFWLLIAFFCVCLLSTIFSLDSHFSLWGNPERNGGFVNLGFFIIFGILAFLLFNKNDWKKILNFSIFIGIIVCLIAIFQQLGLFSYYLIPFSIRPVSSMGNTILLSLVLLLITFFSFSLGLEEKMLYKKIFYLFSSFLFLSVNVFLTQTRGTLVGLIAGALWFFFNYQWKKKRVKIIAASALITLFLLSFGLKIYLDSHTYVYNFFPKITANAIDRALSVFEGTKIMGSRISTWTVSLSALFDKPILGFGPENFMIAFDKHYDPSLPAIGPTSTTINGSRSEAVMNEWWDRAHNIFFDISISFGIPAFLIYLSLFISLIWSLQKARKINPQIANISNALQATFLGYFVALLFSFDSVSTYIIFFLLVGYSFYLISSSKVINSTLPSKIADKLFYFRIPLFIILLFALLSFIYFYNLKPLIINRQMNDAMAYSDSKICNESLKIVNEIYPNVKNSIIDDYLSRKSMLIIYLCVKDQQYRDEALISQAVDIMKATTNAHPSYVQNWLLLAEFANLLIEQRNKTSDFKFSPTDEMLKLKDEANTYFEKAHSLSPRRQVLLNNWADTDIITEEYDKAKIKLKECLSYNSDYVPCIWKMALAEGYSKNKEKFDYYYNLVQEMGGNVESEDSLKQLVDMFIKNNDFLSLVSPYQKLIEITKDNQKKAQLYAALAATFMELKQYSNAKKEAQKIFELIPFFPIDQQTQIRTETESFIQKLGR